MRAAVGGVPVKRPAAGVGGKPRLRRLQGVAAAAARKHRLAHPGVVTGRDLLLLLLPMLLLLLPILLLLLLLLPMLLLWAWRRLIQRPFHLPLGLQSRRAAAAAAAIAAPVPQLAARGGRRGGRGREQRGGAAGPQMLGRPGALRFALRFALREQAGLTRGGVGGRGGRLLGDGPSQKRLVQPATAAAAVVACRIAVSGG